MAGAPISLAELHCPYCGSGLQWNPGEAGDESYGVLACGCARFPVVDGVPVIQHKEGLDKVVRLIEKGHDREALLATLNVFRVTWARKNRWHQLRYRHNCGRLVANTVFSFKDAVNMVRRPQVFSDYLLHRWANPSFLAAVGPMMLFDRIAGSQRVLDLACGAGHSGFVLRWLSPSLSVVSVDHDFVSLYLAKRYFSPEGSFYCLDAEVPSPFPDAGFDAVFCLDAFHYFRSKCAIRDELRRVVRNDGLWVLAHLHNALQANITPGIPLAPEHYLEMFDFLECRLFDEAAILREASCDDRMDLRKQHPAAHLRQVNALSLIAGPPSLWSVHEGFARRLCGVGTNLQVNPIYVRSGGRGTGELALLWPNEVIRKECEAAEAILPSSYRLKEERIRELLDGQHGSELEDLVRRFVLVPLPDHYCRRSAAGTRG
jgi:SAM-dependent methyltransferase/uncharacterized protein YbaR (Trm112 family)